ncbi:MAG: BMP family protein [Anaerolineae bacterium]|nr:BMP family protein [Anaerolineae bacterium]
MKKISIITVALLTVAILLVTACAAAQPAAPAQTEQQAPAAEQQAAPAESGSKGKFALVLSGPRDDNSWNEAGYDALMALKDEGVDVTFSERVAPADAPRVLRELADAGYQMIVAHSFGYQDAVFEVAKEYPDTNFAWGGGINRTDKNVADYDQPFYESAYLAGIIAGHVSKTGKLGAIYGFDIPVCHAMGEALLAGAQTVKPDVTLTSAAAGDWYDAAKAKEAALAQADTGVDFWVQCGEGPTLGAIEAAKEKGGYATGYVGDMTESGPDVVLTNIVWNLRPMFKDMLKTTLDKSFNAPYYRYGIAEGALDLTVNPKLADKIPAEAMQQIEEAKAEIQSGELEVPFVPEAAK